MMSKGKQMTSLAQDEMDKNKRQELKDIDMLVRWNEYDVDLYPMIW